MGLFTLLTLALDQSGSFPISGAHCIPEFGNVPEFGSVYRSRYRELKLVTTIRIKDEKSGRVSF
jgi:hypothetical protein